MMTIRVLFSTIFMTILLVGFQNCQKVAFNGDPGGSLMAKADPDDPNATLGDPTNDDFLDDVIPPGDGSSPDDLLDDPAAGDGTTATGPGNSTHIADPNDPNSCDCVPGGPCADGAKHPNNGKKNPHNVSSNGADGPHLYICILEGPGKSIRLAYAANGLYGKVGTPQVVCMSENACLNIASQHFDVKLAAKRGFCPNKNPHVVEFSDAQMQSKIDELN